MQVNKTIGYSFTSHDSSTVLAPPPTDRSKAGTERTLSPTKDPLTWLRFTNVVVGGGGVSIKAIFRNIFFAKVGEAHNHAIENGKLSSRQLDPRSTFCVNSSCRRRFFCKEIVSTGDPIVIVVVGAFVKQSSHNERP